MPPPRACRNAAPHAITIRNQISSFEVTNEAPFNPVWNLDRCVCRYGHFLGFHTEHSLRTEHRVRTEHHLHTPKVKPRTTGRGLPGRSTRVGGRSQRNLSLHFEGGDGSSIRHRRKVAGPFDGCARILSSPRARRGGYQMRSHQCEDRKSTRLNSSHVSISYAVFCLKKKKKK